MHAPVTVRMIQILHTFTCDNMRSKFFERDHWETKMYQSDIDSAAPDLPQKFSESLQETVTPKSAVPILAQVIASEHVAAAVSGAVRGFFCRHVSSRTRSRW